MINFKKVELDDKAWIDNLLSIADMRGCHLNFTNIFAWKGIYNYQVAKVDNFLLVKGTNLDGINYYFYPIGLGDTKSIIKSMIQDSIEANHNFILAGLSKTNIDEIKGLDLGEFEYTLERDSFDYIYLLEKMVSLSGKKLQSKRNHINRFKDNYQWSFELINSKNLVECWDMNKKWCKLHGCEDDEQLANEACAVRVCFKNYNELRLEGGLIRVDGEIIAFTIADRLNSDTYDIHIEKAFTDFSGSYQMINREFANYLLEKYPDIQYLNREEDMGYDGLRKAKLSYRPVFMEEKYWAKLI